MTKKKFEPVVEEQMPVGEEMQTETEAYAKAISSLTTTNNPQILTDLGEVEIKALSALSTIYNYFDIELGKALVKNFELLRVSKARKGRSEVLSVAKGAREEKERLATRLKRLIGFGPTM